MTNAPFLHQVLLRRRFPTSNNWRALLIAQNEVLETSYCKVRELGHTHIVIFNPISATKQWFLNATTSSLYPKFPVTLNTLMWRDRRKIIVRHRIFHGVCYVVSKFETIYFFKKTETRIQVQHPCRE